MLGKLFVVALFCVAFAQGQDDIDEDLQSSLYRLENMRKSAQRRVDGIVSTVEYKKNSINVRTTEFINRQTRMEEQLLNNLENVALSLENKVQNRPSALECIEKAKSTASENIRKLGPKFEEDMLRLQRTKLENIETASTPFPTIKKNIDAKYEKAVVDMKNCKTPACVRQVLTRTTRDFDALFAQARTALNNINIMYTNFQRDANTFYQNVNRQATGISSLAIRQMRACLSSREEFFTD